MNHFQENLEKSLIQGLFGTVWTELWNEQEFPQNKVTCQSPNDALNKHTRMDPRFKSINKSINKSIKM